MPSELTKMTADNSKLGDQGSTKQYRHLSFEDDLFTARVYKRNCETSQKSSKLKETANLMVGDEERETIVQVGSSYPEGTGSYGQPGLLDRGTAHIEREPLATSSKQTYWKSVPSTATQQLAPVVSVGLACLFGNNNIQVDRNDVNLMAGTEPNQMDTAWRVTTAASLFGYDVKRSDLKIEEDDRTASIAVRARSQEDQRNHKDRAERSTQDSEMVTIDSQKVAIVNDPQHDKWDLNACLVEVDGSSCLRLLRNFQVVLGQIGRDSSADDVTMFLNTIIEDVHVLFARSPVLLRITTRSRIYRSNETRYGISSETNFVTLTTSRVFKEILSCFASIYNSLFEQCTLQTQMRVPFWQTMVLLLSLLNDQDLEQVKDFLEATYSLKSSRYDVELLFVKILPLISVNSHVFINALIQTVEGHPLKDPDKHDHIWKVFIGRILENGYVLPGNLKDLGSTPYSWSVKWSPNGFKSTSVFNTLQYVGRLRTINDIPPIDFNLTLSRCSLIELLKDEKRYAINVTDLRRIEDMIPGTYIVQRVEASSESCELTIHERLVNKNFVKALNIMNAVISDINQYLAESKRRDHRRSKLFDKSTNHQPLLGQTFDTEKCIEITATLANTVLAVTYKLESGNEVSRRDVIKNMTKGSGILRAYIRHLSERGYFHNDKFPGHSHDYFKRSLDEIESQLNLVEQARMVVHAKSPHTRPVLKRFFPERPNHDDSGIWQDYTAWYSKLILHVESRMQVIYHVKWLTDELIELSLNETPYRLVVSPLGSVAEYSRDDEVQIGDVVVLMGKYAAIAESKWDPGEPLTMLNYLKLVEVEEQPIRRRMKSKIAESSQKTVVRFK